MGKIHVTSEIAPLKKVLLHRPGKELLNLTPDSLNRLLFDDIPYLPDAIKEHDEFADLLRQNGVEVVYLEDLMADVLNLSEEIRDKFIKQFVYEAGIRTPKYKYLVIDYLDQITNSKQLVLKTMEGIQISDISRRKRDIEKSLIDQIDEEDKFIADPMPNLYFTRDNFASIGEGISLNKMYSVTRSRETIFGEYIFRYHPKYKKTKLYYDRYDSYSIEGGDIQVLDKNVIAIGISQRTEPDAIALLAKNIFADKQNNFKVILAIDIPDERSFMHLDTVMTRVDYKKFAVHSHVMDISTV